MPTPHAPLQPLTNDPPWQRLAWVLVLFVGWALAYSLAVQSAALMVQLGLASVERGQLPPDPSTALAQVTLRAHVAGLALVLNQGGLVLSAAWVCTRIRVPLAQGFALGRPTGLLVGWAVVGALAAPWLPSWIASQLVEQFPQLGQALDTINQWITAGPLPGRILLLAAITLGAPLFEELLFRGFLWMLIERSVTGFLDQIPGGNPKASRYGRFMAFVGSSVLFAGFHLDPIQSASLLGIAFFLGWLRLVSHSVIPGIIAHVVNNALAAVVIIAWPQAPPVPALVAWVTALGVVAGSAAVFWADRSPN